MSIYFELVFQAVKIDQRKTPNKIRKNAIREKGEFKLINFFSSFVVVIVQYAKEREIYIFLYKFETIINAIPPCMALQYNRNLNAKMCTS